MFRSTEKNTEETKTADFELKKEKFSEILEQARDHYFEFSSQTNWSDFYAEWSTEPTIEFRAIEIEVRKLWISMRKEGSEFVNFIEEHIRENVKSGELDQVYRDLQIYTSLLPDKQVDFYTELLVSENIINSYDGAIRRHLTDFLKKCKGQEVEKALTDYIKRLFATDLLAPDLKEYEISEGIEALYRASGKEREEIIEMLTKEIATLPEWLESYQYKVKLFTHSFGLFDTTPDVFDLELEQKHLQQLEKELQEIKDNPELLDSLKHDSYDILMGQNILGKKGRSLLGETEDDYWVGWNTHEKAYRPENAQEFDQAVMRGSVVLAMKLGKDMGLARDIDIFFKDNNLGGRIRIQEFGNLEEAKTELPVAVHERVKKIIESNHLESLHINIVHTSETALKRMSLVDNEPELVLWNPVLEVKGKLTGQVTDDKKEELKKELMELGIDSEWSDQILSSAQDSEEMSAYREGNLVRGEVPTYLRSRSRSLATALRLIDWGERFDIDTDTGALSSSEIMAVTGDLTIKIPPDLSSGEWIAPAEGMIDQAFYNVVDKKDLYDLLEEQFPVLAKLMKQIKEAGGIREYVRTEYGEIYLTKDSIKLNAIRFNKVDIEKLTLEDQNLVVSTWEENLNLRTLFHADPEQFLKSYLTLDKGVVIGKNADELAELMIQPEIGRLVSSGDIESRQLGYRILGDLALTYQKGGLVSIEYYQSLKQSLKDKLFQEKNKKLRKNLVELFVKLGDTGEDLTIAADFADLVKKESSMIKTKHSETKEALSDDGMMLLRGLLEFGNETAYRAIYELLTNPGIDLRIKKQCLTKLSGSMGTFMSYKIRELVKKDLELSSNLIPWQDYAALISIEKIPSTTAKDLIRWPAHDVFLSIRKTGLLVADVRQEIAPTMNYEFFLPLYKIFNGAKPQIASWGKLLGAIKSNTIRDSFIFNISNLLNYDKNLLDTITENIVESDQDTKERILLVDRLLKKLHFLVTLSSSTGSIKVTNLNINELVKETKPASVLETKLDGMIVSGLYEVTGREDLTSDKIQKLFNAWQDPEPIFIFLAQLAGKIYGPKNDSEEFRTLKLTGEMLAHMDPPSLEEWKKWRYDTTNPVVQEQLRNLTKEQIKSYAEDEFANLGEVLVGLLPSDKPDKIRNAILHGIQHNESGSGSRKTLQKLSKNFFTAAESGLNFDFESVVNSDMQILQRSVGQLDQWLNLDSDRRVLEYLPKELERWQRVESEKRKQLIQLGYKGDESRSDIDRKIIELQKSGSPFQDINKLASLKPGYFTKPIQRFFERYNLTARTSPEEINQVRSSVEQSFLSLSSSTEFRTLVTDIFGSEQKPSRQIFQNIKRDLRAAKTLLQLCSLTPQLIAFDKISNDKKKATLQKSISFLKDYLEQDNEMVNTLQQIEVTISELSTPIGKDNLAIVFTDSPLVSLTIGRYPNGATSCQSYNSGDMVLAAYMADAYTKICLMVDLNKLPAELKDALDKTDDIAKKMQLFNSNTHDFLNASVARRLTKKVDAVGSNAPQLFLEPVYTPLDRESITRLLDAYAVTNLAPRLGIDIVKGGPGGSVRVAESRNIIQYEDGENGGPGGAGGGLGRKYGEYTMPARPIRESDYSISV